MSSFMVLMNATDTEILWALRQDRSQWKIPLSYLTVITTVILHTLI